MGYGAPRVTEAMGRRPVPMPVPLCAATEVKMAKILASVVKAVNGAIAMIAMGMGSVAGGWI